MLTCAALPAWCHRIPPRAPRAAARPARGRPAGRRAPGDQLVRRAAWKPDWRPTAGYSPSCATPATTGRTTAYPSGQLLVGSPEPGASRTARRPGLAPVRRHRGAAAAGGLRAWTRTTAAGPDPGAHRPAQRPRLSCPPAAAAPAPGPGRTPAQRTTLSFRARMQCRPRTAPSACPMSLAHAPPPRSATRASAV